MNHVLVLHSKLGAGPCPEGLALLLTRLPYAKRLELEGREPDARCTSLAGIALALRGMAMMLSEPVGPRHLSFPEAGKPRLPGGPGFSISHSGPHVAVALCSDCEPGFDLEQLEAGGDEQAASRSRLARWTATEALLKAAGRGLRDVTQVGLDACLRTGTVSGASFNLVPVEIADDVVAFLATVNPASVVRVEQVDVSALAP
jgi:phosphopantetheinyl transferase